MLLAAKQPQTLPPNSPDTPHHPVHGGRAAKRGKSPSHKKWHPRELHNCVSERLNAVLKYLNLIACTSLPDYAENDINTVTNIARIMIQDIADVFGVIEQRGFDSLKAQ
ncbi:hypothetical protein [Pseudomonas farris]